MTNLVVLCVLVGFLGLCQSQPVQWAYYSPNTIVKNGVTTYVGYINITRPSGEVQNVTVTFTSSKGISFLQSGPSSADNIDYYKTGEAHSPYISAAVPNSPPAQEMIALKYADTNTFEFSAPLGNLFLVFVSMNAGNTYTFDSYFEIESIDDPALGYACGYWGCGTAAEKNETTNGETQYVLSGTGEPHGVIGFNGSFSSLSFVSSVDENWNGVTIGTYGLAEDIYPPPPPSYPSLPPSSDHVTCIDYLQTTAEPSGVCEVPSLYCIHLVDADKAGQQPSETCTLQNTGAGKFTLSEPNQKVVLSSDAKGQIAPYFDELAVLTVTSKTDDSVDGANYIAWQNDCANPEYEDVTIPNAQPPTAPAIDITKLFGGNYGDFELSLNVWNKYNPYSNLDAYVCTGSALEDGIQADVQEVTTQQQMNGNDLSPSMVVFIAVGSSIGTILLIAVIATIAGIVIVRK